MEIESGFPFISDGEREGEDDYSMGGGEASVLKKVSPKIKQFEKKLRTAKLFKKGVERESGDRSRNFEGKLRLSKHLTYRTVINVGLVKTEISYFVNGIINKSRLVCYTRLHLMLETFHQGC